MTVSDSVFIVDYLKKKYGDKLDAGMSARDRAIAVAFGRMLEESFYWYLVQMRYRKDESFKVYDPIWVEFLDFVPPEQRTGPVKELRERILHEFFWCGKGRHATDEVEEMARQEYDALSSFLADKPYFMGPEPRSIDATVYAWLIHAMRVPFPGPIKDYGNSLPNLVAYCDRMRDRYYPGFA